MEPSRAVVEVAEEHDVETPQCKVVGERFRSPTAAEYAANRALSFGVFIYIDGELYKLADGF